jgi:hypothetical protein
MNAVVHDVTTAFRYEDNIEQLRIWNTTLGLGVLRPFQAAASTAAGLDVQNVLILGPRPREAVGASNLTVDAQAFVDAFRHDYTAVQGAPQIDAGATLANVETDRLDTRRPQGRAYDVGAYEAPGRSPATR